MFKRLRLKNFKGWEDTGTLRMAPISLLFGANSSGKSSIGQFLMMLKQTVESSDRKAVFNPGGRNDAVHLGSYREMVFRRDPEKAIAFEYEWAPTEAVRFREPMSGQEYSGDHLGFEGAVGLGNGDRQTLVLHRLNYRLSRGSEACVEVGMQRRPDPGAHTEYYRLEARNYRVKRKGNRTWYPVTPVRFYGFPDEVLAYHQNVDFVRDLNLQHERLFRSVFYLGPLRTKAERLYSWTGMEPESVGYAGENTVAAILAARGRRISLGPRRPRRLFEEIIALKLREMGLIEAFSVNAISSDRQEYEVKVRTRGAGEWVDLPDVGFGISQVLPVLVQCFHAPPGSIIIMEQPEIHLHPSAQSALADVMIDAIRAREEGGDRNIQLIIETHSEHFLRRLQRRIAEERVPGDMVSAYFADITKSPATLNPLEIDDFGNIRNWPENFFGDEMADITGQAKAAVKKRMRERTGG